jgi:hypothetical protein
MKQFNLDSDKGALVQDPEGDLIHIADHYAEIARLQGGHRQTLSELVARIDLQGRRVRFLEGEVERLEKERDGGELGHDFG